MHWGGGYLLRGVLLRTPRIFEKKLISAEGPAFRSVDAVLEEAVADRPARAFGRIAGLGVEVATVRAAPPPQLSPDSPPRRSWGFVHLGGGVCARDHRTPAE